MNSTPYPISPYRAELTCRDLRRMVRIVRLLHKLSLNTAYSLYLNDSLPVTGRYNPGHHAVMMGYDFHLDERGPKLIEVNTNAGGLWYASLTEHPSSGVFPGRLGSKLLKTFLDDYALYSRKAGTRPAFLVILDEHPEQQMLYPEMQVFKALFEKAGISVEITDAESIDSNSGALYWRGKRIDMIYNRHCDFYLETPALEKVKSAWLNGQVCLSPHPRTYGLLADKRRMILWSEPELMKSFGLSDREQAILAESIPETRLLASLTVEEAWRTRKQWVFKPDTGYASRGVYVGEKLTKSKYAELGRSDTVIQKRVQPSITHGSDGEEFKTDYRLFAYGNRVFYLSSRLYQGQVTNLRTVRGGFAKVCLK